MGNKPVLTSSLIVAAVAAIIAILNAYGISVGDARAKALEDAIPIIWVLGFAIYYAAKQGVTPNTEVASLKSAAYDDGRTHERSAMLLYAAGTNAPLMRGDNQVTRDAVEQIKRYCPPTMIAPTSPAASVVPAGPVDGGSPAHAAAIVS